MAGSMTFQKLSNTEPKYASVYYQFPTNEPLFHRFKIPLYKPTRETKHKLYIALEKIELFGQAKNNALVGLNMEELNDG